MKRIILTVTNDLSFDQRMQRICQSLALGGYAVTLVGRLRRQSLPLQATAYRQIRIPCHFEKGFMFYAEYNLRLFYFLLRQKADAVCAIDLDTILPCLFVSVLKQTIRIYDAHELFTEMKEVRTRPLVHRFWLAVERFAVPRFPNGYTVGKCLAAEFKKRYGVSYSVISNMPSLQEQPLAAKQKGYLLYQGAVNEGRGLEWLVPAMKQIPFPLVVCGDGNFMDQMKQLIRENGVEGKVELKGMLPPSDLGAVSAGAFLGINLVEKEGLNQYLSLANKFFDYIHAGLPQLTMDYPEYRAVNDQFEVAVLIGELSVKSIVDAVNQFASNLALQHRLRHNCLEARKHLNWQLEEEKLLYFYKRILG